VERGAEKQHENNGWIRRGVAPEIG
jgi:hypothetical protein